MGITATISSKGDKGSKIKVCWICFFLLSFLLSNGSVFSSELPNRPVSQGPKEKQPLRLAIPSFKKEYGDSKYDSLERALPEILATGIIDIEQMIYVGHDQFWRVATTIYPRKEYLGNPAVVFSEKMMDRMSIDVVVRGTFVEYGGSLRMEAYIDDRHDGKKTKITSKVFENTALLNGIMSFVQEMAGELKAIEKQHSSRRVAVLCFTDNRSLSFSGEENLGENLAISLIANIEVKDYIAVLPWSATRDVCDMDRLNVRELVKVLNADLMVTGNLSVNNSRLSIVPLLYVKGASNFVELNPVIGEMNNYFSLEKKLIQELSSVLESIVNPDGTLNTVDLLSVSHNKEENLNKGKTLIKHPESQPMASLMFKRALDAEPADYESQYYLGVSKLNQRRYSEAVGDLARAVELNPGYEPAQTKLGDTYLELGEYKLALASYRKALALATTQSAILETRIKIGKMGYLLKDYPMAIRQLEQVRREQPSNIDACLLLARVYLSADQNSKALSIYKHIYKQNPDDPGLRETLYNRYVEEGRNLIKQRKYPESLVYLNEAANIREEPQLMALLIDLNNRLGRYSKAKIAFERAEIKGIADAQAYHHFGWTLYFLSNYNGALRAFSKAISLDAHEANFYNSRGWILDKLDRIPDAMDDYRRAIALDPNMLQAYNNLSYDLNHTERYREALDVAEKGISINPNYANLHNQKGFSLFKLDRLQEGLECIATAIRINPSYGGAYFNRAIISAEQGNYGRAFRDLEKAVEINESYKQKARLHPAFKSISGSRKFERLGSD